MRPVNKSFRCSPLCLLFTLDYRVSEGPVITRALHTRIDLNDAFRKSRYSPLMRENNKPAG